MRVRTEHLGRLMPFERDRRLVLRRLPVDALVQRAVLTLTPVSSDPDRQFLESLTFQDSVGDWGATKIATSSAVEIDLHARRRLARMRGVNLNGAELLVDLGGGFLEVDGNGGFGGSGTFSLSDSVMLPRIGVTGLRTPSPLSNPDVSQLWVSSPPSNVTVAIEGGPVFFSHIGDLMEPATTPDFADLLHGMLSGLDQGHGCVLVPFVLHSDTIARLDVTLEIDYAVESTASADGVRTVAAQYAYDGTPVPGQGMLAVSAPPGMVAVPGGTTGRAQGAFAESRVVFGPVTEASAAELVTVAAGQSLAQQITLPVTTVASSVDLLLTAVSADVELAVDVVDDLDGKPGRASLLGGSADIRFTRDDAGSPTWLNVPLPSQTEFAAGSTCWVVVQARVGTAAWSAAAAADEQPPSPGLQATTDGGLSWRAASAGPPDTMLRAPLRLRHTTAGFEMPVELRVGAGGDEVAVDLERFAASGGVDVELDFPEVAQAINAALSSAGAGGPPGGGERVANGDFLDWYRVGTAVAHSRSLTVSPDADPEQPDHVFGAVAFGADSGTVHAVVGANLDEAEPQYARFDVFSGQPLVQQPIGGGSQPLALTLDTAGSTALVSMLSPIVLTHARGSSPGSLVLVSAESGSAIGAPVPTLEPVLGLAATADGVGAYLVGRRATADGPTVVVRHVSWSALRAGAAGSAIDWSTLPSATLDGVFRHLATGPDGRLVLLLQRSVDVEHGEAGTEIVSFANRAAVAAADRQTVQAPSGTVQLAVSVDGAEILALGRDGVRYLRAGDLRTLTDLPFPDQSRASGYAIALAPDGDVAVVVRQEGMDVLDVRHRRWLASPSVTPPVSAAGGRLVISPAGTHAALASGGVGHADLFTIGDALPVEWEVTAGRVRPVSLPSTGEVFALLGDQAGISGRRATPPAAISQVVPVSGGVRYRFSFDGISSVTGGIAQVRWSGQACAPERTDRVSVSVFDFASGRSLQRIPHHDIALTAPHGATQAEVRFYVPEAAMAVDRVSLLASSDVAGDSWAPSDPATVVLPADAGGTTVSNGAATTQAVSQVAAVRAGDVYELSVRAQVREAPDATFELAFADDAGAGVGEVVSVPLRTLDFDARAAGGIVPAGAAEAVLSLVLPPGAVVELSELTFSVAAAAQVDLYFAAQAPGDLRVTDLGVAFEAGEPVPLPVPEGGLCPATPTGPGPDGEACHCQSCGSVRPVRRATAVITPAGRPAVVTPCPTCGTDRLRLGGRVGFRPQRPVLREFQAPDREISVSGSRPTVTRLRVREPLEVIDGIGTSRAAMLRARGISDLVSLSRAAVATVAALRGVSPEMAERYINEARRIVQERGVHVLFD